MHFRGNDFFFKMKQRMNCWFKLIDKISNKIWIFKKKILQKTLKYRILSHNTNILKFHTNKKINRESISHDIVPSHTHTKTPAKHTNITSDTYSRNKWTFPYNTHEWPPIINKNTCLFLVYRWNFCSINIHRLYMNETIPHISINRSLLWWQKLSRPNNKPESIMISWVLKRSIYLVSFRHKLHQQKKVGANSK